MTNDLHWKKMAGKLPLKIKNWQIWQKLKLILKSHLPERWFLIIERKGDEPQDEKPREILAFLKNESESTRYFQGTPLPSRHYYSFKL